MSESIRVTAVIAVAVCLSTTSAQDTPETSAHFPATVVTDVDGNEVALPAADCKATVLVFLSCECPIANAFAPELGRVHKAYADQGVAFFRVYPAEYESAEDVREHTKEYVYAFPALRDAEFALVKRCGARVTPEAVVMDADGAITYRGRINDLYTDVGRRRRTPTTADLRDAIDATLAGEVGKTVEKRAFGCFILPALARSAEDGGES